MYDRSELFVGSRVRHVVRGSGSVIRFGSMYMVVRWDSAGETREFLDDESVVLVGIIDALDGDNRPAANGDVFETEMLHRLARQEKQDGAGVNVSR